MLSKQQTRSLRGRSMRAQLKASKSHSSAVHCTRVLSTYLLLLLLLLLFLLLVLVLVLVLDITITTITISISIISS